MNQKTSGNLELEKKLNDILDEYSNANNIYLPSNPPEDIAQYLNMGRDFIESLPREACYSIAFKLAQYALYIQKLLNREKARIKWADSVLYNSCAPDWDNYDKYLKADIKISIIARENAFVQKTLSVKNHAEVRAQDLEGVAQIIERMAFILEKSAYGKNN